MVCNIGNRTIAHTTYLTRDNETGIERTFKKQEQERDDITGRYHATDPTIDNDTGIKRKFQRQEQDMDDSMGQYHATDPLVSSQHFS